MAQKSDVAASFLLAQFFAIFGVALCFLMSQFGSSSDNATRMVKRTVISPLLRLEEQAEAELQQLTATTPTSVGCPRAKNLGVDPSLLNQVVVAVEELLVFHPKIQSGYC